MRPAGIGAGIRSNRTTDESDYPVRILSPIILAGTSGKFHLGDCRTVFIIGSSASFLFNNLMTMRLGNTGDFFPIARGMGLQSSGFKSLTLKNDDVSDYRVTIMYSADPDLRLFRHDTQLILP